jgi:AcrR family transcriptional regulator
MTSERRRGPYSKGVQRRQEILDRAFEVFADRGFEGTSLRAIGEALGISHAALRHYFSSREALLVEVLRQRDAQSTARVADLPTVVERMSAAADANVGVPGLAALHTTLMASSVEPGNEDSKAFFTERFRSARELLAGQLRDELTARDTVPDVDLDAVAALILAAFDGLQIQWLLDRSVDIAGTLRLIDRIIEPR